MIDLRNEILKPLPIPSFYDWWHDNWGGTGFHVWADELLEMRDEGVVKIERGGGGWSLKVQMFNPQLNLNRSTNDQ